LNFSNSSLCTASISLLIPASSAYLKNRV
jgi:hypothetical protein